MEAGTKGGRASKQQVEMSYGSGAGVGVIVAVVVVVVAVVVAVVGAGVVAGALVVVLAVANCFSHRRMGADDDPPRERDGVNNARGEDIRATQTCAVPQPDPRVGGHAPHVNGSRQRPRVRIRCSRNQFTFKLQTDRMRPRTARVAPTPRLPRGRARAPHVNYDISNPRK